MTNLIIMYSLKFHHYCILQTLTTITSSFLQTSSCCAQTRIFTVIAYCKRSPQLRDLSCRHFPAVPGLAAGEPARESQPRGGPA